MYRLNARDFSGETGFATHTGMRSYEAPMGWKASGAEEGVLIASDGTVTTVMPGSELRLDNRNTGLKYDLFVFIRGGTLTGRIGAGGISAPDGTIIGSFGEFRCSLLMARRCAPLASAAFSGGMPVSRTVADLLRPALRRAVEAVLAQSASADFAVLRAQAEHAALKPMNDLLIPHGLQLESLHLEWLGPTEENHEKRR